MTSKTRLNLTHFSDLRTYFKEFYLASHQKNSSLTQAAFAKFIGCSSSTWNNFTKGRRQLSAKKITEIGSRLKWTEAEHSHALSLRSMNDSNSTQTFSRNIVEQAAARSKLATRPFHLSEDVGLEINLLSVVLIECVRVPEYHRDPVLAVERLGFSRKLAESTLRKLLEQNVLELDSEGIYRKTGVSMVVVAENQSEMLRSFYKQMLSAAIYRIRPENTERRYLGSETFAFSPELLPDAKKIVNQCLDDLASLSFRCENPSTVYHAGVQLFEILEKFA